MCKQFLSFVGLTAFALIYAGPRASADPTEDSDRQFLSSLENGPVTQPPPARAPDPVPNTPAPVTKTLKPKAVPQEAVALKPAGPEKPLKRIHKPVLQERAPQPAEVASADPVPAAAGQKVIVVQSPDPDPDRDHDQDHHHFFHRLFGRLLGQHPEDW